MFVFVFVTFIQLTFATFGLLGQARPNRPKSVFRYVLAWSVLHITLHTNWRLRYSEIRSATISSMAIDCRRCPKQLAPTTIYHACHSVHTNTHTICIMYANGGIDVCSFYHSGISYGL